MNLRALAHNLGNLWRRLVLPTRIDTWSLTSLQQRLLKTGGRLVKHTRYYWLLLAESHLTRRLFGSMLQRIWAARANRLTGVRCRRSWVKRGPKADEVSVGIARASCRASQFGLPGGCFDARSRRG